MRKIPGSVRQTNLLLALNMCMQNNRPLTLEWAMRNVEGYMPDLQERQNPGEMITATMRKRLQRDVKAWQEAGVPIQGDQASGYRLDPTDAFLPAIDFNDAELDLLELVANNALSNSFNEHARLGLLKLLSQVAYDTTELDAPEAATAQRTTRPSKVLSLMDWNTSDPTVIARLTEASRSAQVVNFRYVRPSETLETASTRTIVPWSIVSHRNRLYVVGWDMQHEQQRLYRLAHMYQLATTTATGPKAPADFDGAAAVEQWFAGLDERVDAEIAYAGDEQLYLLKDAKELSPGIYQLRDVSKQWLIKNALAAAPAAVVLAPENIRAEIQAALSQAVANIEQQGAKAHA